MRKLLFIVLLTLPLGGWAALGGLDEDTAVRLGLARGDLLDVEQGQLAAVRADALAATLPANPGVAWSRETGSTASEQTWQLSQTFDLSGRRALRSAAAQHLVGAAQASLDARRVELAAEIRRRFHELLYRQENVHATARWVESYARIEAVVEKLVRHGEASGHDLRRLARERRSAEARLAIERADLERVRERLAALSADVPGGTVLGELLPGPLPDLAGALEQVAQRPDLAALLSRADAADLERRAAARGWIPELTAALGIKRSEAGEASERAGLIGVAVVVPLFDRQQAREARAGGEALAARGEYAIAVRRAQGELRGLHRQGERLREAALAFRRDALSATPELLRIAEAAYRGGEASLLELLDAYRGALEAESTALTLAWRAREARIDYDQLTGRSEP